MIFCQKRKRENRQSETKHICYYMTTSDSSKIVKKKKIGCFTYMYGFNKLILKSLFFVLL